MTYRASGTYTRDTSNDIIPENNVTISITDPNNTYKYVDINGTEIVNYTVNKDSMKNITVKIVADVQYVNLSLSYDNYSSLVPSYGWVKVNGTEVSVPSVIPIIKGQQTEVMLFPSTGAGPNYISINETMVSTEENIDMSHRVDVYRFTPTTDTSLGIYID